MTKNKKKIIMIGIFVGIVIYFLVPVISNLSKTEEIRASGTIQGREIIISSQVGGEIRLIVKDEGDSVSEGELLLEIDDQDYQLIFSKAQSALKIAQAKLQEALKGSPHAELQKTMTLIAQAEANTNTLNIKKEKIDQDYQKMEILFNSGGISKSELDKIKSEVDILAEQIKASKKQEENAYWQLQIMKSGARDEIIESLEAQLQISKSDLLLAENKLNQTKLKSPIKGRINGLYIDKGELVMPGSPVISVIDPEDLWLKIYIPETEIGKVFLGQEAVLRVDSFIDKDFSGKVVSISDQAQFTPKNVQTKDQRTSTVFPVKIKIENNFDELKSGITAEVRLIPREKKDE